MANKERRSESQELDFQIDQFFRKLEEPKLKYKNLSDIRVLVDGLRALGGEVTVTGDQMALIRNNKRVVYAIPTQADTRKILFDPLLPAEMSEGVNDPWTGLLEFSPTERGVFHQNVLNALCHEEAESVSEYRQDFLPLYLLHLDDLRQTKSISSPRSLVFRNGDNSLQGEVPKYLHRLIGKDRAMLFIKMDMVAQFVGNWLSENHYFEQITSHPIHRARMYVHTFYGDPQSVQSEFTRTFFTMNSRIFIAVITKGITEGLFSKDQFNNFDDLIAVMETDWYKQILQSATIAYNGFWAKQLKDSSLPSLWERRRDGLVFTSQFRQARAHELRELNRETSENKEAYEHNMDNKIRAQSTTGCPVRQNIVEYSFDRTKPNYIPEEKIKQWTQGRGAIATKVGPGKIRFHRNVITDIYLPIFIDALKEVNPYLTE